MSSDVRPPEPAAGVDAQLIADAVCAVPGVAGLHAGMFGEVATYLPGRRISGVRIGEDRIDIHVSLLLGAPLQPTAHAIQQAVTELTALPVDVTIEDLLAERS